VVFVEARMEIIGGKEKRSDGYQLRDVLEVAMIHEKPKSLMD
jgi:hypothetical protein